MHRIILSLTLLIVTMVTCARTSETHDSIKSLRGSDPDSPEVDQLIGSTEPRQYFKLSSASQDGGTKGLRRTTQLVRRALAAPVDQQEQPPVKHKITNANLKKLLNQSLLKANATSGGAKSNNFKLLFIQRATAAPSSSFSKPLSTKTGSTSPSQTSTVQPSLAASVSKQLASSLINSAVSLIDNLDSTLSDTDKHSSTNELQVSHESGSSSSNSGNTGSSDLTDIKRIYTLESKPKGKKANGKPKQPSKIYNLPVKFVSNGQPNHVVFTALKQHFATIKKIQAATKASSAAMNGQAKRRKQQQVHHKTKGNSRLIYLPLKYLSNARPNRIISGKVTHKQSTSSGGSS